MFRQSCSPSAAEPLGLQGADALFTSAQCLSYGMGQLGIWFLPRISPSAILNILVESAAVAVPVLTAFTAPVCRFAPLPIEFVRRGFFGGPVLSFAKPNQSSHGAWAVEQI